jgi:hypothetical protein
VPYGDAPYGDATYGDGGEEAPPTDAIIAVGQDSAGASGSYNSYFETMATNLIAQGWGNAILRIGWEWDVNGGNGWYVGNTTDAANYALFFRQIVTTMRAVAGANFHFSWYYGDGVWNGAPGYEGVGNGSGAGISACGISYFAVIPKQAEVEAGVIPHMINIQLPSGGAPGYAPTNSNGQRSPGTQSDMDSNAAYATHPQEGMVFRWPTSVSMPGGLAPIAQMIFTAGQDYGIICMDIAGAYQTVLMGPSGGTDYCLAALDGQEPYSVLDGLPWSSLVALEIPSSWPPGWT